MAIWFAIPAVISLVGSMASSAKGGGGGIMSMLMPGGGGDSVSESITNVSTGDVSQSVHVSVNASGYNAGEGELFQPGQSYYDFAGVVATVKAKGARAGPLHGLMDISLIGGVLFVGYLVMRQ